MKSESRVLKLAQDLIRTNSENPPGLEAGVAKVLREHMESYGMSCVSVGSAARPNMVFSTGEMQGGQLVLHGHMDTVPAGPADNWSVRPFDGVIEHGRLYGRGACDMKGPLAALAEAMILYSETKHTTPLLMLATSDEERGCSGAEEVAKSGILQGVPYGVCAEPTGLDVLVGEKGMLWTRVVAHGKSSHGSRPEEGTNAIRLCTDAIEVLTGTGYEYVPDSLMGSPTINVGYIKGGIAINVVPDYCEALIDMRLVKGQDTMRILDLMRKRIADSGLRGKIEIEYVHGKPAVVTPRDSRIVDAALEAVRIVGGPSAEPRAATFGTDCSVLQPKIGVVNVICGPGSIENAHQPDEYIELHDLYESVYIYLKIAESIGEKNG